jgi:hypothetical protein
LNGLEAVEAQPRRKCYLKKIKKCVFKSGKKGGTRRGAEVGEEYSGDGEQLLCSLRSFFSLSPPCLLKKTTTKAHRSGLADF